MELVIKESVRAALTEEKVPERVPVERKQVERAAVRNHKIRTDTGIEISFPAEMGSNSEYIEFVNEPNGLISIELKTSGQLRIHKLRLDAAKKQRPKPRMRASAFLLGAELPRRLSISSTKTTQSEQGDVKRRALTFWSCPTIEC